MGITNDRGRFYWVKRVPKRFAGLVLGANGKPVTHVRQALRTDSKAEAKVKGAQVEAARLAEWEALAAGDKPGARKHYEAARKLAQLRGFAYRPVDDLAAGEVIELVNRVLNLAERGMVLPQNLSESPVVAESVLGAVPEVMPTLPEMFAEYVDLTKTRHLKKSDAQRHKWYLPRERAVRNFIDLTAPKNSAGTPKPQPVNKISRTDALAFRAWWSDRVEGGMKIESANKDFGHLKEIFGTWVELKNVPLANPFKKMRLDGKDERTKPAFSREWVKAQLLAPESLASMNSEARDVFLITINTGLRPSEITDTPLEDFETSAKIPFIRVAPNGRELKVMHTRRDIPLLGVALDAARRIVARGGIARYRHKAGAWSAAVNKYLAHHGLKESPDHTAYSVRHYVENALLAARVDDRVRADIMGHKYHRPSYGDGGALEGRREALKLIAL